MQFIYYLILITIYNITIIVCQQEGGPKLGTTFRDVVKEEGAYATLSCSIGAGNKDSLIFEWYKNNNLIDYEQNGRIRNIVDSDLEESKLKLSNLTRDDEGTYTCVARNKFGSDKILIKLKIKGEFLQPISARHHFFTKLKSSAY